ncbi:MAG: hypothetical protein MRK00_07420 [Nitrosomonas sp.]|nr:hypothetical protein [Nitrosomonas sp.]
MKAIASTLLTSNNTNSKALLVVLLISALLLAVLSGIFSAFGNVILLIPLLALFGVFFVLAAPVSWTVWIIFLAAFLVTGPSAYFIRFSQLQWLTVFVSAALLLPALLYLIRIQIGAQPTQFLRHFFWPGIFLLFVTFSTLINDPQFGDVVNGSRHYFLMWPLMLVFMLGLVRQDMQVQLWKALMIVAILQLPMAIYQYFFVALKSMRFSPWDSVIGTFPGNIEGGGESAGMAFMLLIAMLTAIALWREGKLSSTWMALVVFAGLGTLLLAEVKAIVMLLPFAIGLYYRRELMKKPMESILVMLGTLLLAGAIFMAYEKIHYGNISTSTFNTNQAASTYDRVMSALNPETVSLGGNELGRVTHIVNWWAINIKSGDLQHSLFGYGMGATFASRFGVGELVGRFPYTIAGSSTIILLWEVGILGHLAFLFVLLSGARASGRAAKNETIPEMHRIFLRVGAVGLLILTITLPYTSFHLYANPIQFLMMFMLGQAAYWSCFVKSPKQFSDKK